MYYGSFLGHKCIGFPYIVHRIPAYFQINSNKLFDLPILLPCNCTKYLFLNSRINQKIMNRDPILFWNEAALEANRISHSTKLDSGTLGPTQSSRTLAIIHLAMYDAYAKAKGNVNLPAYLPNLPAAPAGVAPAAAVAGAAYKTLTVLYPSQIAYFNTQLNSASAFLTAQGVSAADLSNSISFGDQVGTLMLTDRQGDPNASDLGYAAPTSKKYDHRPTPDNINQGYHGPLYGRDAKCFAVTSRHSLGVPPLPGDPAYTAALRQVRGKGIAPELMGTVPTGIPTRTIDETVVGVYWGYDGANLLGTPPRLYNQIVRKIAEAKGNTTDDNARLFALVNVALGDAGILAWEQKYVHNLWRPVVGVREHDQSTGPEQHTQPSDNLNNDCDTHWMPFGAPNSNVIGRNSTPPFPAYPSGHATFGAAAFQIVRLFYGVTADGPDNLCNGLSFISDEMNGVTTDNNGIVRPCHDRKFSEGLWQMMEENGLSRIYLVVHWSFDAFALDANGKMDVRKNLGGVDLGISIAEDIFNGGKNLGLKKSTV
jgi:vanadium chloroperoxidase